MRTPFAVQAGFNCPDILSSLTAGAIVVRRVDVFGEEDMRKKLAAAAALVTLAMTLSACQIVSVERPDKDGKPDHHHTEAGQST